MLLNTDSSAVVDINVAESYGVDVTFTFFDEYDQPIDLSGMVFKMVVSKNESGSYVVREFGVGSGLLVDENRLIVRVSKEALNLPSYHYWYDIRQSDGAIDSRLFRGRFIVSHSQTKSV